MEAEQLKRYLNKTVKINISTGFYWRGRVLAVTPDSISLLDMYGAEVSFASSMVVMIEEVRK